MDSTLPLTTTVTATRHHVSCDLSEEVVILQLQDGIYYGLNPVGARVWALVQEPRTVEDIKASLLNEYEVEPSQCDRDLATLLSELSIRQLIEVRHEGCDTVSRPPNV